MKKITGILLCVLAVFGCSKHDPILPGVRHEIFDSGDIFISNKDVPDLSGNIKNISGDEDCNYRQDASNNIWHVDKKIYTGFASNTVVNSKQSPICKGSFLYTGLSNGSVIKLNRNNNKIVWETDVYKENVFMGGSAIIDVIAHVGFDNGFVYAGGLGDAFCKLDAGNGNKIWCLNISVPVDFIIVDNFAFVVGADNNLYAININNGEVYWKTEIKKQVKPKYDEKIITVGKQRINYKTGVLFK